MNPFSKYERRIPAKARSTRRTLTTKRRAMLALAAAGCAGVLALPTLDSSSAAYVDGATANTQAIGSPALFGIEVKANNNGNLWSAATTEATAAVVNGIVDTTAPVGAVSKPLIVTSSARVTAQSPVGGRIIPTITAPSTCTGPCASIYDYVVITAWWGTTQSPTTTLVATDVSIADFNSLAERSTLGTPGVEQLLTLKLTLLRAPVSTYNGVSTQIGIVYTGQTDSTLVS
ncbi:hypothetical protein [Lysinibacter cavernae]|uniref:Tat pathway signal sequence domain protein n=1 Tax=Lysinibacter cavernae TaxID=1640652 RepID=A0A7X5TT35_9MICO|nr:hypothetical protein [Lysinibacter cavernae]NIH52883.1 hypothetical protein [Lysinibacter cavernae]